MFSKFFLDFQSNLFEPLSESTEFEDVAKGRKGANLVDYRNGSIPLVRTTTIYRGPNKKFSDVHYGIIDSIKKITRDNNLEFNNALIEIYDTEYSKMGYHSDQSLDLNGSSFIGIFSCYDDPTTKSLRTLRIKNKLTDKEDDIALEHNSIILFSVATNQKYLHKIILESNTVNCRWLGITFRRSKTFIVFHNELPYFSNGKILALANKDQRKEFYKYKSLENSSTEYVYPDVDYTVSVGDTICI